LLRLKGVQMAEIVRFVSKSELERLRLIREARAIYDSIFPPTDAASERSDDRASTGDAIALEGPDHSKGAMPISRLRR
jgi:hypothetical protein